MLTYYNGTIKGDSGATTVDLTITLEVDVNGQTFNPFFDFTFELVNSQNVAGDEWGSADFVEIVDPRASRPLVFNDYEFEFRVEFGNATSNGFGAFDEFHVLENKSASVDVFGTFINLGLVTENTSPLEGGNTISIEPGTGTDADPIFQKVGYVEYLVTIAKTERDNAKSGRDTASLADSDASKDAADAVASADEARGYATEARSYADSAAFAASQASSLPTDP
jgi:hypothetical protein